MMPQQVVIRGGSSFVNNTAGQGGAIAAVNNASVTLEDGVIFLRNSAWDASGGAVALPGPNSSVTVRGGVNFTENNSKKLGGAIYAALRSKVGWELCQEECGMLH
jgi:predicted outer membrane repeat protein